MDEGQIHCIGVDLDSHSGLDLMRVYFNSLRFGKVRCFYTRHGFHLVICLDHGVSLEDALRLRALLGDDAKRLEYDEMKIGLGLGHTVDTLFEWKRGRDGRVYRRWEFKVIHQR